MRVGQNTRYDFSYDFCRIRTKRVFFLSHTNKTCIQTKSYTNMSQDRVAYDKKNVEHVQHSYDYRMKISQSVNRKNKFKNICVRNSNFEH